jgi:hypothetical protein
MDIEINNVMVSYTEAVFKHDDIQISSGLLDAQEAKELGLDLIGPAKLELLAALKANEEYCNCVDKKICISCKKDVPFNGAIYCSEKCRFTDKNTEIRKAGQAALAMAEAEVSDGK